MERHEETSVPTIISLLRNCDRPREVSKLMDDAASALVRMRQALEALEAVGYLKNSSCASPEGKKALKLAREALK